jgi:hypothetical protein
MHLTLGDRHAIGLWLRLNAGDLDKLGCFIPRVQHLPRELGWRASDRPEAVREEMALMKRALFDHNGEVSAEPCDDFFRGTLRCE